MSLLDAISAGIIVICIFIYGAGCWFVGYMRGQEKRIITELVKRIKSNHLNNK